MKIFRLIGITDIVYGYIYSAYSHFCSELMFLTFSLLPVQTSSVQTDHEVVRRTGNQEEGKGSKRYA